MSAKEASLLVSNVYVSEGSSKLILDALKVQTKVCKQKVYKTETLKPKDSPAATDDQTSCSGAEIAAASQTGSNTADLH